MNNHARIKRYSSVTQTGGGMRLPKSPYSIRSFAMTKNVFLCYNWEDYFFCQKNDKKILRKINELIKGVISEPFSGSGKPGPLKYALEGY